MSLCHLFRLLVAMLLLAAPASVPGQSLPEAERSARLDLQAALDELAAMQKGIGDERIPLAQQLNSIEDQVLSRRREFERSQRAQENQLVDLNVLRTEVKRLQEENGYLGGLFNEYTRLFETRIHISETRRFKDVIEQSQLASLNADLSPAEKAERQIALLQRSLARLESLAGGETFEGQALTPSGRIENGRFVLVGPVAAFASSQSEAAGLAELQLGSPEPTVIALDARLTSGIKALASGTVGDLPVDATLGNAIKIAGQRETIFEHVRKGGPVMVPILLLGFAALSICAIKWRQISRIQTAAPRDLQVILNSLEEGQKAKAIAHARSIPGPVGEMLVTAIEHAREKKEYIEEVLYEKMLVTRPKLERLMPIIALSATTAPLLGLLGTVTGMINTFNMITLFGTGDPRTLAGGISEALITTEFGLIVAVPSLLLHAFISRKVKGVLGSMEQTAVAFINGVPETETEETSQYA